MRCFATEFPVQPDRTADDFLHATVRWLTGSPHVSFTAADFRDMADHQSWRLRKGDALVELLRFSSGDDEGVAVRYTLLDGGQEWVTRIVFSRGRNECWVGTRVSCESLSPSAYMYPGRKPIIVRLLLEELGRVADGPMLMDSQPYRLQDSEVPLAARLLTCGTACWLPIVYVSTGLDGSYLVDVDRLATDLDGMAHVVVEPNRHFSQRLRLEVQGENVYGGTIGIYWPQGGGRRAFFRGPQFESAEELARQIVDEVRRALTNRRPRPRCSWAWVQEGHSRQTIDALKASGSRALHEYIASFDAEQQALRRQLDAAEEEIGRLREDLQRHEAGLAAEGVLLRPGSEQDFYEGEAAGFVREALQDALRNTQEGWRRHHVLAAMLKANPLREDLNSRYREQVKSALKDGRLDARDLRQLEEIGFAINANGKHLKLIFMDDPRYMVTIARTPGDGRSARNATAEVLRLVF